MFHQLTIFEMEPKPKEFKHGDIVQVIKLTQDMDIETYFYLQDFANIKGLIEKVVRRPKLQYEVDFNGKTGIVYHEELERWTRH